MKIGEARDLFVDGINSWSSGSCGFEHLPILVSVGVLFGVFSICYSGWSHFYWICYAYDVLYV